MGYDDAETASWAEYSTTLGFKLRERRHALGLAQDFVAQSADISVGYYRQLERGFWRAEKPSDPRLQVLVRLSQVLETGLHSLLPDALTVVWADHNEGGIST